MSCYDLSYRAIWIIPRENLKKTNLRFTVNSWRDSCTVHTNICWLCLLPTYSPLFMKFWKVVLVNMYCTLTSNTHKISRNAQVPPLHAASWNSAWQYVHHVSVMHTNQCQHAPPTLYCTLAENLQYNHITLYVLGTWNANEHISENTFLIYKVWRKAWCEMRFNKSLKGPISFNLIIE